MTGNAEVTERIRKAWDSAAEVYDREVTPALDEGQRTLMRLVGPLGGLEVLDLGCGTGVVTEMAVRAGARVTAVDLAPAMIRQAGTKPALAGVDLRVMDAQALDLPDRSFDVVVASFSLFMCPQPERAFAEAARVLRPGGLMAISVWGLPRECETVTVGRVAARFAEGPAPEGPTGQSLGDPVELERLLREAGFASVDLHPRRLRLRYATADALWHAVLHVHGARIPPARIAEAEAATKAEIARVGLPLRNAAWFALARTPA